MRRYSGCLSRAAVVGIWLVAATLALTLCALGSLYAGGREQMVAAFEPPIVFVTHPISGTWPYAGAAFSVSATAIGATSPITRAELWLDGVLKETENSPSPNGVERMLAHFDLTLSEGPHMIIVRAFNAAGMAGQSLPLSFVARPKVPSEFTRIALASPQETIGMIAHSTNSDPATLQTLNPALGSGPLAGGTQVVLPRSPDQDAQETIAAPGGATLPPGSSPAPMPAVPPLQAVDPTQLLLNPNLVLGLLVARPPAAPSELQAQVVDCKIKLRWNDNATNEDQYEVWMAGMGLPPSKLATLQAATGGATWYEFTAPQPGYFSMWVEAVNAIGRQPSNIVWVSVGSQCSTTVGSQLRIDLLDISVGGNVDKVYCYVSLGGAPNIRLPEHDFTFIAVKAGQGDIAAQPFSLTVPRPDSGALDVSGECWGWSGKSLNQLGSFSGKFGPETWTGARQVLGSSFQIGFTIKPLGETSKRDPTRWRSPGDPPPSNPPSGFIPEYVEDPTLPVPYGLNLQQPVEQPICASPFYDLNMGLLKCKTLQWKWDGDQQKITGFIVYADEIGPWYTVPGPGVRQTLVTTPHFQCAGTKWQVAAVAGSARSKLSDPIEQAGPEHCNVYVKVKFENISLHSKCPVDSYFKLNAQVQDHEITRWFYGWGSSGPQPLTGISTVTLRCGPNSFEDMVDSLKQPLDWTELGPKPWSAFIISLPAEAKAYATAPFTVWVRANFADSGKYNLRYDFASLPDATAFLSCGKKFYEKNQGGDGVGILTYEMTIYPNECGEAPAPEPK